MVKDLRTEHETGNVDGVLDGDVDRFMESYLQWQRGERRRRLMVPPTRERATGNVFVMFAAALRVAAPSGAAHRP